MKFSVGTIVRTPSVAVAFTFEQRLDALTRHMAGDWGDLSDEDKEANETALAEGLRLLSAYEYEGEKLWIITEADRSSTTLLLPEEY